MNKNTIIALLVFVGLIAVAAVVTNREPSRNISKVSLAHVKADAVTKITLSGKHAAELAKDGDTWKIKFGDRSKRADENMVKRMLEAVPKIVSSDLVTSTEARYEELEVNDEKGTKVQLMAGAKEVASFVVGASAGGGTNIRVGSDVYKVKGVYPTNFAREKSAWVDKKLFGDKLDAVVSAKVSIAGQPAYSLSKKDSKWVVDGDVLPAGFRFDSNAAQRIVSGLINLRAKTVLDADPGTDKTGLAAPATPDMFAYVIKEGDKEVTREVTFGATEEGAVYAQVAGEVDIYTVYESTVKNMRKQPTELREMTMINIDKDKVVRLDVVGEDGKITLEKKGADWSIAKSSKKLSAEFQLDPAAVTRRVSALANARATKVAADVSLAKAGLKRPSATLIATLEGGEKVTLAIGGKTKVDERDFVYARGNIDDAVYLVTDYMRKNLTGGLSTFEKKEEPAGGMGGMGGLGGIDPKALSGLPPDVRKQLEQQMKQKQSQQKMIEQMSKQAKR